MRHDLVKPELIGKRAKRINEACQLTSLTLPEIAGRIGVSPSIFRGWLIGGMVEDNQLRSLAEITGTSYRWLAFGEGPISIAPLILQELLSSYPDAEWRLEHAELLRVVLMKKADGTLGQEFLENVNLIIECLDPLARGSETPTKNLDHQNKDSASCLDHQAVHSIVMSAVQPSGPAPI